MKTKLQGKRQAYTMFLHSVNGDVAELFTFIKKQGNALRFPKHQKAFEMSSFLSNIIEIGWLLWQKGTNHGFIRHLVKIR